MRRQCISTFAFFIASKPEENQICVVRRRIQSHAVPLGSRTSRHFHGRAQGRLATSHDPAHYARFKAWCDQYFHLPHREEHRGIGGIFFDTLGAGEPTARDARSRARRRGRVSSPALPPDRGRRRNSTTAKQDRAWQLMRRGRYVEFNLVWTTAARPSGSQTRGRTEAILPFDASARALALCVGAQPGTPEAALYSEFLAPRDWLTQ